VSQKAGGLAGSPRCERLRHSPPVRHRVEEWGERGLDLRDRVSAPVAGLVDLVPRARYSLVVSADPDRERRFDVRSAEKLNAEGEVLLPLGLTEKQQTRSFQPVRGL
jgi:hypothetical protein